MNPRILLIEDNEQNRYLATFLLEKHGFTVTHAPTGRDGVALALSQPFDLVLLDIQLPDVEGYAVAQSLRSHPALRLLPIIAVTSYAMAGDRDKALAAGCTGYIEKPIDPDSFVTQIRAHLPSL